MDDAKIIFKICTSEYSVRSRELGLSTVCIKDKIAITFPISIYTHGEQY